MFKDSETTNSEFSKLDCFWRKKTESKLTNQNCITCYVIDHEIVKKKMVFESDLQDRYILGKMVHIQLFKV